MEAWKILKDILYNPCIAELQLLSGPGMTDLVGASTLAL